jgi:hypothetical protein
MIIIQDASESAIESYFLGLFLKKLDIRPRMRCISLSFCQKYCLWRHFGDRTTNWKATDDQHHEFLCPLGHKPIVCQMARHLPNQRVKFLSRVDRLEAHLVKNNDFDNKVKAALPQAWLPFVQADTAFILDLSDVAKPYAKKMDYLATVRDGSTGALVNGYWLVELYASLSRKKPMMLLTNLRVANHKDAKCVLRFYIRRWECEEAIRFLKSQVNLEKIRTFRWTAICRLVLLSVLVMMYLGWLVEEHPHICDRLVYLRQPLPDNPDFLAYRLLTGLTEAINTCFWLHKDLLRKNLW